jgi:hypothetical protein
MNQRGYALLIVLFIIIITLSLSAVFISTSLNHVTQEKTTDQHNQAYVAAEMGTKYYSTYFENELKEIEQNIKTTIVNPRVNNLKLCERQVPKGNKCNNSKKMTDELALINRDSLKEFNEEINVLLSKFNDEIATKEVTSQTIFLPTLIQPSQISLGAPIQEFTYSIKGISGPNQASEKTLETTVEINIPSYVPSTLLENPVVNDSSDVNMIKPTNLQNCAPVNQLVIPYECDLGNAKLIDLINELNLNLINKEDVMVWTNNLIDAICPQGVCLPDLKGLTIKSDQSQTFDISNKTTSNGNIVFPGNVQMESVGNHLNLDLIVESMSVKNVLQHVSKNIVVLGNKAGTGFFEVEGKKKDINVSMESGYKLCLNLDGLNDDSTNIKLTGAHRGELIYYSTKNENISGGIKHTGTYYEFLKSCTINIDPIKDPIQTPNVNIVNVDFKVVVDYFN